MHLPQDTSFILTPRYLLLWVVFGTLALSSLASLFFHGEVRHEFVFTGLFASLVVGFLAIWYQQALMARIEKALEKSEQLNEQVVNNIEEGILVVDRDMRYRLWNNYLAGHFGVAAKDVLGRRCDEIFPLLDDQMAVIRRTLEGEVVELPDEPYSFPERGKSGWFSAYYMPLREPAGRIIGGVGIIRDITERKVAEDEIRHLAFYDPLTRLPNRRLLLDRLQQTLANSARSGLYGALLFIDLDNFKTLNDTLGHDKGDLLLQQVAGHLVGCVRECDTVARLGGDEFVVMLAGLDADTAEAAAHTTAVGRKILDMLNQVYYLAFHEHFSSASIGITLFNGYRCSIDELLKQADIAMYQAKTAGRNTLRFFDPEMQSAISARAALEKDLRHALAEGQFRLYYQPQVCHSGRVVGAEALLRWYHPEDGLVSPVDFIPLTEESGLILPIGQWVLESACDQLKSWEGSRRTRDLQLAVNISARQFHQHNFIDMVLQTLQSKRVNPARLKFELTESVVLRSVSDAVAKMHALKAIGLRFSMDDFGTGYSSLAYLTQLPFDQLKIDQSFVRNIGVKPTDAVIIQTIIGMAGNLGMEVVAEGVETEAQRAFLELHGCRLCQGYLFGRPVPLAEFERGLEETANPA